MNYNSVQTLGFFGLKIYESEAGNLITMPIVVLCSSILSMHTKGQANLFSIL